MRIAFHFWVILVLSSVLFGHHATAQNKPAQKKPAQNKTAAPLSPKHEATALTFAKRHHAELASLLDQLKEMDAQKYQSAIQELFRTSERLSRYQKRMPDRYKSDLEIWKIDSRVRLIVARSVNGMEDETRKQVKGLLLKRNQIRFRQLTSDRKKQQDRLKRLDEQISQLKTDSDTIAERDLDRLMRSVRNRSKTRKKPSAAKTTPVATKNSKTKNKKKTSPKK